MKKHVTSALVYFSVAATGGVAGYVGSMATESAREGRQAQNCLETLAENSQNLTIDRTAIGNRQTELPFEKHMGRYGQHVSAACGSNEAALMFVRSLEL